MNDAAEGAAPHKRTGEKKAGSCEDDDALIEQREGLGALCEDGRK